MIECSCCYLSAGNCRCASGPLILDPAAARDWWSGLLHVARGERDEARALLDQQAALHAEAERIKRSAFNRCVTLGERIDALSAEVADVRGDLADAEAEIVRWRVGSAGLEAERDAALAHAGTLLAVVERVADRLTAEDGVGVARLMADVARQRRAERDALARAEAERDALRARLTPAENLVAEARLLAGVLRSRLDGDAGSTERTVSAMVRFLESFPEEAP